MHARSCRVACLLALGACARPVPPPRPPGYYDQAAAWLCRPDLPNDPCHGDLDTTVIRDDLVRVVVHASPAAAPPVDCFYVYPTVDLGLAPANHVHFDDLDAITSVTRAQAARFTQVCALYVPLYRQITIGTYLRGGDRERDGLALAYGDVSAAFRTYLAAHPGRRIVLIGHSQGAEMVIRLLRDFFEGDPAMRARLVVALAIGGHVTAPFRHAVGGTFAHVPLCTAPGQTGCVIAYRSYRAGDVPREPRPALPAGQQEACVDPGNPADPTATATLDATYPRSRVATSGIATPYVSYPAQYAARCAGSSTGAQGLEIADTPGPRRPPVDLDRPALGTSLGTHVLDFQIALDDLVELVRRAAAASGS
jgi:Protein of unknown function (DUF3089)